MAKKDTYLALLRRGIDEKTAQILSDGGIKVGDLKTLDVETLINNYGLKKEIATSYLTLLNLVLVHQQNKGILLMYFQIVAIRRKLTKLRSRDLEESRKISMLNY